jgi:heat-inducible transcriptional repressor
MDNSIARNSPISLLNDRSREVFRRIVEAYLETGEPVGSRTLSRQLTEKVSPATIRNVMADLQDAGLIHAPHTSAGRLPTDRGLQLFVNGLLEIGSLTEDERHSIEGHFSSTGRSINEALEDATQMLSGLAQCASLIATPTADAPLKHVEFVPLAPGRALVVLVSQSGMVENRLIELPAELPQSALVEAGNYLNAQLHGRTVEEARAEIERELQERRAQLDELSSKVVEAGLATWSGESQSHSALIVRGQARLLQDVSALEDLERIRQLFEMLETRESMLRLLDLTNRAHGVQIFIGADNPLFSSNGWSMVVSPIQAGSQKIVGAVGVVGPTRINYARVIPMVDYTAEVISRMIR